VARGRGARGPASASARGGPVAQAAMESESRGRSAQVPNFDL